LDASGIIHEKCRKNSFAAPKLENLQLKIKLLQRFGHNMAKTGDA